MEEQSLQNHSLFEPVPMGIGVWAWGDRLFWGYGQSYGESDVEDAFRTCVQLGFTFFDTAELYGQGKSEELLGKFIHENPDSFQIATKFMPFPWRLTKNSLFRALRKSLDRLQLKSVSLYQIHQPLPPVNVETWMEAMADCYQAGLISAVGVSNYNLAYTQRAFDSLIRQGIRLASNQVEYSLLNRQIEFNGLLAHCRDLGVKVIAYSPLAQGLLTGKYTPENPPRGFRAYRYNLKELKPLLTLMKKIGDAHEGKTPAQIALNWTIQKGTFPIPGVKNAKQAIVNAGALGWSLTEEDMDQLDTVSEKVIQSS